jgi:hypothetical protein
MRVMAVAEPVEVGARLTMPDLARLRSSFLALTESTTVCGGDIYRAKGRTFTRGMLYTVCMESACIVYGAKDVLRVAPYGSLEEAGKKG